MTKDDLICCFFTHVYSVIGGATLAGDGRRGGDACSKLGTYSMPMTVFGRETVRGRKRGFGGLREK
ncbi:hypothetical protein TorRG33x02_031130, partial [Trema orientale]